MNQTKKQLEQPVSKVHSQPCTYTWCHVVAGVSAGHILPQSQCCRLQMQEWMQECQKLVWKVVQTPKQHTTFNLQSVNFLEGSNECDVPVLLRQTYHHLFGQMESLQAA